jgi:cytochrome oxidase Cu insertion factor (SCO1/SenC/PrrC family)
MLQRAAARLVGSPFFWVLFLAIAFGWPIVRVARTALPPPLPELGIVSEFALVDQNGRDFSSADVRGRVWLLSGVDPGGPVADKLATELGKVQHRARNLGPAFHLVTVGLDSERDIRERLLEFTGHHRVSPRMWSFLSGESAGLRKTFEQGGPLSVVLVDQKMRVRARYDLGDSGAVDLILYHAGLLVNRGD